MNFLLMTVLVAFRVLGRHRMRSALTMLGIIIGVGAVIAMVSIGEGAKAAVQAQIASFGTNVITILPGAMTLGGVRTGHGGGGAARPRGEWEGREKSRGGDCRHG